MIVVGTFVLLTTNSTQKESNKRIHNINIVLTMICAVIIVVSEKNATVTTTAAANGDEKCPIFD
jgi:hypothetical protein